MDKNINLLHLLQIPQYHFVIVTDGIPVQADIITDIAFQLPDFLLQGVDLLVDGFQLGGIGDGCLLFLQILDGSSRVFWGSTQSTSRPMTFRLATSSACHGSLTDAALSAAVSSSLASHSTSTILYRATTLPLLLLWATRMDYAN